MRQLGEKQAQEMAEKRERQEIGARALADWYETSQSQYKESRKNANKEKEWAFLELREKHKSEPWAKIIDSCEMG